MTLTDSGTVQSSGRKLFALSFALVLFLVGQTAVAGDARDKSVDVYIGDEMAKRRVPGLALAVIRHGRVQRIASYGYASLEFSIPVTSTTLLNIKSATKAFTAAC